MDRSGIVIGVGNAFRRDDGVGPVIVGALGGARDVATAELSGEPTALLDAWKDRPFAIVVDAVAGAGLPGTTDIVRVGRDPIPWRGRGLGTHDIELTQTIELGEALGLMPEQLYIVGVYGIDFRNGPGLSASVADRVTDIVAQVEGLITSLAVEPSDTSVDEEGA